MQQLGVLCHITSLPNKYGVGDFGKSAKDFVDYIHSKRLKIWQILPLQNTNECNCPYGSMSSFTIDEMFVDLDSLLEEQLITEQDVFSLKQYGDNEKINYAFIKKEKLRLFELAYKNLPASQMLIVQDFAKSNPKYFEYGYYKVLLEHFGAKSWKETPKEFWKTTSKSAIDFKTKKHQEILKYVYFQYTLLSQWLKIKNYANELGIQIYGDMPIYLDHSSLDVFLNPEIFKLERDLSLRITGGVPPDEFCKHGQNWNTCIYNWKTIKAQNYRWMILKIKHLLNHYNKVRIDHFPGLVEHYEIDNKNPKNNAWVKAGGMELFKEIEKSIDTKNLIIEYFSNTPNECTKVKNAYNLTQMNILQFAFDTDEHNPHLPENVDQNTIYYLGTHDNNTFLGYLNNLDTKTKQRIKKYLKTPTNNNKEIMELCIKKMLSSKADTIILQIQDFLMQGEEHRINTPGQAFGCWEYRVPRNYKTLFSKNLHKFLN